MVLQAGAVVAALLIAYWDAFASYLRDQHYQEHYVYLLVFLGLALHRSLRGPFRARWGLELARDRWALLGIAAATVLLSGGLLAGSPTAQRSSIVIFATSFALAVVPGWTARRCVLHGLLLLMCLGLPYSLYFPLTSKLQWGVASLVGLPASLGFTDFEVRANVVVFPHYELVITPDCSGFGQLLTFLGIAALGILGSAPNRPRSVLALVLAVVLAWLSNLARVAVFVAAVGSGWTAAVDDESLHMAIGMLVYMPFVVALVWFLVRTHRPIRRDPFQVPAGRFAVAWLASPLLAAHLAFGIGDPVAPEPAYWRDIESPPAHRLEERAPSEAWDRKAYGTPWLVNARFVDGEGRWFDLLHYVTRSRSHLCVHKVEACLFQPGAVFRYRPPVTVDGREWWRIAIEGPDAETTSHVYFAFEIGGRRHDDSNWTLWAALVARALGGDADVRLWRIVLPGPLPDQPDEYAQRVLAWIGHVADDPRRGAPPGGR